MRLVTAVLRLLGLRERALRARRRLSRAVRARAEPRGIDLFSRPAMHGMDRAVSALIDRDGDFYEAGAKDGLTQANTYWLERFRGWRGVLIEPMPVLVDECHLERPDARVVHAALVAASDGAGAGAVRMQFGGLMSSVHGAHGDADAERRWVEPGLAIGWFESYEADVPARTLSEILDEERAPEIDLLSLDVEGFEPEALRGLDLERHAPRWILVEAHDVTAGRAAIEASLGERYVLEEQLSPLDLMYRRRDVRQRPSERR
jgi:FkbM family methyltransferase